MTTRAYPSWLRLVQRLRAIARTGLTYTQDPYDRERYAALLDLAAEVAALGSDGVATAIRDLFSHDVGPATPKIDLRAAVFRTNPCGALEILLVRERSDGQWSLPGGWAEVGESPAEGVFREVREEAGYIVRPTKLLAVLDRSRHGHPPHPEYIYTVIMQCEPLGTTPDGGRLATHEIGDVSFFSEDALPPLSLTRVIPAQLTRWFEHAGHPARPTEFD